MIPTALTGRELAVLEMLAEDKLVLELGAWYGASTVSLARTAVIVHSVDWHHGDEHAGRQDTLTRFLNNLEANEVADKVVIHVGRFEQVLPVMCSHWFGLVFHDGCHTSDAVRRDLEAARRLVERGGVFAVHDYGQAGHTAGVTRAVDETLGRPDEVIDTLAIIGT